MTLDEAIKHAETVAEEKKVQAWEAQLQEEYGKVKSCKECAEEHRQLAGWLKELKQLREQTRWIPVSKRLPDIHNYSKLYLVTLKRGGVHIAMFTECDGKHWWTYDDVVAWIPVLPEPYKVESENKTE